MQPAYIHDMVCTAACLRGALCRSVGSSERSSKSKYPSMLNARCYLATMRNAWRMNPR